MSLIGTTDADFRICRIDLDALVRLQQSTEDRGWSTRWTSVDAMRSQVISDWVLLQTFQRQRAAGGDEVVRCLLLFATENHGAAGGVATLDVEPGALVLLDRIDDDPAVRSAMVDLFMLATGGIAMMTKR
ncbi:hypothetical protein [Cellulomonas telluris]|uniref:hypothetical protein n=1 Tax=Cellulomonas telluris TaxID=2306636 RepID=UPI0010A88479|nr:hypothetical protein [Cellulomonas telluris]